MSKTMDFGIASCEGLEIADSVIHIADIHFWRLVRNPLHLLSKRFFGNLTVWTHRRHEFLLDRAEPYADAVAATGVKTVLLTGDFCSTSSPPEFEMAARFLRGLRERGLTLYVLPGNHDVYTFGAARAKRFERYLGEFLPPQYPSRTLLPGGTPLILAPTVCPRHFSARGYIAPAAVESVGGLMADIGGPALVAGHYPMLNRTHGYYSNRFRRLQNGEMLRRALGETGKPILYTAGHVHRFSFERDAAYPRLLHLTTGAFFRTMTHAGTQGEFTEIRVGDAGFEVVHHVHRDGWRQETVDPK